MTKKSGKETKGKNKIEKGGNWKEAEKWREQGGE